MPALDTTLTAGDRVVLFDPPHVSLHGQVADVTEHAVHVRWDDMHDHQPDALIGRDGLRHRLYLEGAEPRWNDPR